MGPYASRMPWCVFGDPAEQLSRARRACGLPVPGGLTNRNSAHRQEKGPTRVRTDIPARCPEHAQLAENPPIALDDDATLHAMGYPRKLTRRFQAFDNFAISFTIINIISGIFSSFGFGLNAGGPRILVFGWIGVSVMVLFVGASMGEVASAYPTSGALYFSAGKLAKRHKGAWSWYTGWLNFVGQVGGTAATDYAAATFLQAFITMQWPSYEPTPHRDGADHSADHPAPGARQHLHRAPGRRAEPDLRVVAAESDSW